MIRRMAGMILGGAVVIGQGVTQLPPAPTPRTAPTPHPGPQLPRTYVVIQGDGRVQFLTVIPLAPSRPSVGGYLRK